MIDPSTDVIKREAEFQRTKKQLIFTTEVAAQLSTPASPMTKSFFDFKRLIPEFTLQGWVNAAGKCDSMGINFESVIHSHEDVT